MNCQNCDKDITPETNEDGIQFFGDNCAFCETNYCEFCFAQHECSGHEKELEICQWCAKEIWLKDEKPINDMGEIFCLKDWIQKPWLNKVA